MIIPLRIKLIATIGLTVISTVGAFSYVCLQQRRAELEAAMTESLRAESLRSAGEIALVLQTIATVADSFANTMEVEPNLSKSQIYAGLRRNTLQNPAIYGVAVAFAPGTFPDRAGFTPYVHRAPKAKFPDRLESIDISKIDHYTERDWFQRPQRSRSAAWSSPRFDRSDGNVTIATYSAPFFQNGRFRGVVAVDIDLATLRNTLHWNKDEAARSFILAQDFTYIYDSQVKNNGRTSWLDEAKTGEPAFDRLKKSIKSGKADFQVAIWRGQSRHIATAPVPSTGWILGVQRPSAQLAAAAWSELSPLIQYVAVALILALSLIYVVVGWMLSPLHQFKRATQQIGQGELEIALDSRRNDELGQLALTMNELAEQLRQRENSLRESQGERFTEMLERLDGRVFYYSVLPSGEVSYVSPSVENVLGFTPEEFKRNWQHGSPASETSSLRSMVLKGEFPAACEIVYTHKDGSTRRVEVCERPLLGANGAVLSVEGFGCDITEQSRAADWFRNLIEAAPDGIVITDQQERILLVNRRTEEIYGYSRDDLIGQSAEILRPETARRSRPNWKWNSLERNRLADQGVLFDLLGERQNGESFPMDISQQPLRLDNQWGELVSTTIRDISDRHEAEKDLRESEQRGRIAADVGKLTFVDYNAETGASRINGYLTRLLSLPDSNEQRYIRLEDYMPVEDREASGAKRTAIIDSDATEYNLEYRLYDAENILHPMKVWGNIARDPAGKAVRITAVLQDITEQKRAEEELSRINAELAERTADLAQALGSTTSQLKGIMDNSPAAIWAKDLDGVYLFANEAYRTIFSVKEDEVVGLTDDAIFSPEAAAGFRRNDAQVIETRGKSTFVETVGLANGVEYVLSVKFPLFDQAGNVYAVAGMCLDVTEQRRLQDELKTLNEGLESRVEARTNELSHAYEALQESESRLSKTTENAPCLIYQFMIRPDGTAYSKHGRYHNSA